MTRLAQTLDHRLRQWPRETARAVEKEVTALIKSADRQLGSKSRKSNGRKRPDPFFADRNLFAGDSPPDTAARHDDHLYGERS